MIEILYYCKTMVVMQHLVLASVLAVVKLPLISAI